MDGEIGNLSNQQPSQQPPKKYSIFGVEILIIIIFFLLTVVILNYFNILPLSKLLPDYLGFLPHRPYELLHKKETTRVKQGFPIVSLVEPAKQTLMGYLPLILAPSFVPTSLANINLKEDNGTKQNVSGTWNTKDGKAITILTVSPNGREIYQLLIFFPYSSALPISTEYAQSTTPKLFTITPKGKWACKTIPNTMNYCENFWEEQDGVRKGIALKESISLSPAKKITISFCEHSQESILYSWKSCTKEFAETGIQL